MQGQDQLAGGPGRQLKSQALSRSMTTLVVGGVLPSMPMRTPFTPALPTGILFCGAGDHRFRQFHQERAGELSLLTRGVTVSLEVISIWRLSAPGTTFTCCKRLSEFDACSFAARALAAGAGFVAAATGFAAD